MTDCPRFGKLFGGCKFVGRYDVLDENPSAEQITAATEEALMCDVPEIIGKLTGGKTIYVRDICMRCGRTVERDSKSP